LFFSVSFGLRIKVYKMEVHDEGAGQSIEEGEHCGENQQVVDVEGATKHSDR